MADRARVVGQDSMLSDRLTLLAVKITAVLAAVAICVGFWMLLAEMLHRVLD